MEYTLLIVVKAKDGYTSYGIRKKLSNLAKKGKITYYAYEVGGDRAELWRKGVDIVFGISEQPSKEQLIKMLDYILGYIEPALFLIEKGKYEKAGKYCQGAIAFIKKAKEAIEQSGS